MTPDLRYPIGPFETPGSSTNADRAARLANIAALPDALRGAVRGLTEAQLDTPYRPGGWTVRQLVHHVADSHINAYCRIKLALTEDDPTIRPYDEKRWAELPDARLPVDVSLALLDAIHARWSAVLAALTPAEFARPMQHPETGGHTVDSMVALYDWHGRHHTAHITALRAREGW
jgi:uncharacterized damage-inducible protein DinB